MELHLSTWQEVEAYLTRSAGIIIPIGSTEQHGPNGLIGTDAICPAVIAREAAREADILVAPAFNVGSAQHHMAFPGTMTLRPSTMIAAMMDWAVSLMRHGFTHLYWRNVHGGNIATINAAFAEIHARSSLARDGNSPQVHLRLASWWELPGVFKLCQELYPKGHGSHATPSEVSVTYYAYPGAVKKVAMTPEVAPEGPIHDAADYRRRFPDGRIGSDPSQASPDDGQKIAQAAGKALIQDYEAFLKG